MYEIGGQEITLEQLQSKAKEYGMDFDSYMEAMKKKGLVEKTTGSQTEDATAEPVSTASSSEDGSLEPRKQTKRWGGLVPVVVESNEVDIVDPFVSPSETRDKISEIKARNSQQYKDLESRLNSVPAMSQEAADIKSQMDLIIKDSLDFSKSKTLREYNSKKNRVESIENQIRDYNTNYLKTFQEMGLPLNEAVNKANEKSQELRSRLETESVKVDQYDVKIIQDGLDEIKTSRKDDNYTNASEVEDETIFLNNLVEEEIINDLGIKGLDKASKNGFNVKEKENIISSAKEKALIKGYNNLGPLVEDIDALEADFNASKNILELEYESITNQLKSLGQVTSSSSQEDIDKYNSLINKISNLSEKQNELNANAEKINGMKSDLAKRQETLFSELSYNAIDRSFKNAFKATDIIKDWKDQFVKPKSKSIVYDKIKSFGDILMTFGEASIDQIYDSTIGVGAYLGYAISGTKDDKYYTSSDALYDSWTSVSETEILPISDIGASLTNQDYKPGDKSWGQQFVDKDSWNLNGRSSGKAIAEMLPFTLGLILSGGESGFAQVASMTKKTANIYQKGKKITSLMSPKFMQSTKAKEALRMIDVTGRMTIVDNYSDAQDKGLTGMQAHAYANGLSLATGLVQMIMPDKNFLKTKAGQEVLSTFTGSLKKAANKKAISTATKQFVTNIGKELGEEELELALSDIVKMSVLNTHNPELFDLKAQQQTIAGTMLLSGSLGSVGARGTYKAAKKQVYDEFKLKGKEIIQSIDLELEALSKAYRDKRRTGKSKDIIENNFNQLQDTKEWAESINRAINVAPEAVTAEQIDLLVEKNRLQEEKAKLDKSFHGDIENQIASIDDAIANSEIIAKQEEIFEKTNDKIAKLVGGEAFKTFETTKEVEEYLISQGYDKAKASTDARQEGFVLPFDDGRRIIVVNKEVSRQGGATNVAAHEYLHNVIREVMESDPKIAEQIGFGLGKYLAEIDLEQLVDSKLARKLALYKENPKSVQATEVLTMFSDALATGDIKYEETLFTKVGDTIRRLAQSFGYRIKFDKPKDVFNFIKDYNASIAGKGKLNKAQRQMLEGKKQPTGKLTEITEEQATGRTESEIAFSKANRTVLEEINNLLPENIKTKEDYNNFLDDPRSFMKLYEATQDDGVISNYVKSRTTNRAEFEEAIDSVIMRLRNFDPSKQRKEGGVVGKEGFGEFVFANTNFGKLDARKALAIKAEQAKETTSLDAEESFVQVADESAAFDEEVTPAKEKAKKPKINVLRIGKVASKENQIVDTVEVKEGDTFKEVLTNNTGKVGEVIFNVPSAKLTDATKNLTYAKKIVDGIPESSEAGNIQNFFSDAETVRNFIKILPKTNVSDQTADVNLLGENIDVSRDVLGLGLGTSNNVLKYFYNKTTKRSKGKKSQPFIWELKDEFVNPSKEQIEQFQAALGITPRGQLNNYDRNTGQLLKGVAKMMAGQASLSAAQRQLETKGAPKQQVADITAAQSKIAFSKAEQVVNIRSTFELETKGIDKLLSIYGVGNTFNLKTKQGVDEFVKAVKEQLLPLMPKEFWFGKGGGTVFTPSSKIIGKGENNKKLYKEYYEPAMKALANDPSVKFGKPINGVSDFSVSSYSTIFKNSSVIQSNIKNGKIDAWNKKVALIHSEMWKRFNESISKNKDNAKVIGNYLKMVGSDTGHWHKRGAQFVGYSTNPKLRYEYEHAMPATAAYLYLIDSSLSNSNFQASYEIVTNNYKLMALDKAMDKKLTAVGLQRRMPIGWDLVENNWWDRYFNKDVYSIDKGIDPESIKTINGQTFGSQFNVNAEGNPNVTIPSEGKPVLSKAISKVRTVKEYSKTSRGMSTFDFDETLIIDGENFVVANKDGESVKIPSDKWPIDGPRYAEEGYTFDFSDFVNVRGGKEGPLLQKMKNQIKKYGPNNVFVLTARMQDAAEPIHKWLKSKGINIPLDNITGLGKSEGDAKAQWFIDKYAEGYNDMYFVDDALPNVEAVKHVFDQLDVKGKSVQARIQFSKSLDTRFNQMLERTKGVGAEKRFSRVVAKKRGKNVGRFQFFVPPSADDFAGLLRYFVGKGEQGNADLEFFNEALIKPFARADREMSMLRQAILGDYKKLRKEYPDIKKKLGKMMPNSDFTLDNAIRVYLWNKAGFEIPGLSKRDISNLVGRVEADVITKAFADALGLISRQEKGYSKPGENWNTETIAYDLQNIATKVSRKKFLGEWIENKDEIFTPENLNKIEAVYGTAFREALVDVLYRMENGTNRSSNRSYGQGWTNWVNGSVGAIMFFNSRSAVLQTLSMVNFVNFEDNNIFAAGKAFANQKQYWSDFSALYNSDFLKNRRAGLATNVNEAELANAVAGATNKAKAAIGYLLKIGFTPTQMADSFAIASGGATFYRNRINRYIKEGLDKKAAEEKAFLDFQEIAEETQQSARPDRISQQQASPLGRLILAFANTPLQYNRLMKKAAGDLINRRGDWRANVSRILYYGAIQNAIFAAMQQAVFALAFDDDDDEEMVDKKGLRLVNSMSDSVLRGMGIGGAAVSTLKNVILEFMEQSEKGYKADYGQVVVEAFNVSPPMGSKARKLYSALNTYKFNKDAMGEMDTFDYNNPIWEAAGNITSAGLNLPLDRAIRKIDNLREAFNQENSAMQRAFLLLGWSVWDLDVGEEMIMNKGRSNEYVKLMPLKQKAQYEAEQRKEAREKKKKKANQRQCSKIKSNGRRCKVMVNKPKTRCHFHD